MRVSKIRMKPRCETSDSLLEIDEIFLTGCLSDGFYKKAVVYDYLKQHAGSIQVDRYPYPDLLPALSINNEKYVKSVPNITRRDNLLSLPRV